SSIPSSFALEQNYPNPFNPSTTIQFSLRLPSFVTLKVYNILGEEVTILVVENLPSGNYKVEWNASRLTSGVYYYRLQAGEFVETKKLTLLK
ncbi:T9SS type A sorting domain-containing protein, partial [candidate division KSB1 bacterium]|nr:T9SS type A sorting domain-containing protein [candidate division KSB1 bacterium]